jgi:hypothetical protein
MVYYQIMAEISDVFESLDPEQQERIAARLNEKLDQPCSLESGLDGPCMSEGCEVMITRAGMAVGNCVFRGVAETKSVPSAE